MIAGNFATYELTIANAGHGELDLADVVATEKTIVINPGATSTRLLLTPSSSTTVADVHDFLLANEANYFEIGRGLNRISIYNGSGGEAKVSIAVMF